MSSILRRAGTGVAISMLFAVVGTPAGAQVTETRESSANPMVEVFKSTAYGGLAGLLLGTAIVLAVDDEDGGEVVRWGFVGGTFFGFGYGVYHVSTRPQPQGALLDRRRGEWALAMPALSVDRGTGPDRTAGLAPPLREDGLVVVRAPLARVHF